MNEMTHPTRTSRGVVDRAKRRILGLEAKGFTRQEAAEKVCRLMKEEEGLDLVDRLRSFVTPQRREDLLPPPSFQEPCRWEPSGATIRCTWLLPTGRM